MDSDRRATTALAHAHDFASTAATPHLNAPPHASSYIDDPVIIANMRGAASAISASRYKDGATMAVAVAGANEMCGLQNYRLQTLPLWGKIRSVSDVFVLLRDVFLGMIIFYLLTSSAAMKGAHEHLDWAFAADINSGPAFLTSSGSVAAACLFGTMYFAGSFFV